jgi:dipeptidase D
METRIRKILDQNCKLVKVFKYVSLWTKFAVISSFPRGSKNEAAIANYILNEFANFTRLKPVQDSAGNVLVTLPAYPGMESAPSVCLQSHLDMVCVKTPESTHNFNEDSIEFVLKGEFPEEKLTANGTSLGADNGIGVAAMFELMDNQTIKHGPLELLFTVEEETGLNGVSKLSSGFVKSKIVINLDSEDWGELYISSAGGMRTKGFLRFSYFDFEKQPRVKITVTGFKGGHSGLQINRPHENPIKVLGRLISKVNGPASLVQISGGEKFNAIPSDAFAVLSIEEDEIPFLMGVVDGFRETIEEEIGSFEPDFKITLEVLQTQKREIKTIPFGTTETICKLISVIPHGVIRMSPNVKDLVQTSNNLASIKTTRNGVSFQMMQRGSVNSEAFEVVHIIDSIFSLAGGFTTHSGWYSGWKANPDSAILKRAEDVFVSLFKERPKVKAIHAGLECGVLAGKYPGLDIISFGPTIKSPHSPDEYVDVFSVERFWEFLQVLLRVVPEINQSR